MSLTTLLASRFIATAGTVESTHAAHIVPLKMDDVEKTRLEEIELWRLTGKRDVAIPDHLSFCLVHLPSLASHPAMHLPHSINEYYLRCLRHVPHLRIHLSVVCQLQQELATDTEAMAAEMSALDQTVTTLDSEIRSTRAEENRVEASVASLQAALHAATGYDSGNGGGGSEVVRQERDDHPDLTSPGTDDEAQLLPPAHTQQPPPPAANSSKPLLLQALPQAQPPLITHVSLRDALEQLSGPYADDVNAAS